MVTPLWEVSIARMTQNLPTTLEGRRTCSQYRVVREAVRELERNRLQKVRARRKRCRTSPCLRRRQLSTLHYSTRRSLYNMGSNKGASILKWEGNPRALLTMREIFIIPWRRYRPVISAQRGSQAIEMWLTLGGVRVASGMIKKMTMWALLRQRECNHQGQRN